MVDRIRQLADDMIEVTGPAIVRTRHSDYEIMTDVSLKFPHDAEVFLKVWPEEQDG